MKKIVARIGIITLVYFPVVASAAADANNNFGSLAKFFEATTGFINSALIPILLAIAFLVFISGAIIYLVLPGKEGSAKNEEGRRLMLWGIIGFVLIVSVWGIVSLIANGLSLNDKQLKNTPIAPTMR